VRRLGLKGDGTWHAIKPHVTTSDEEMSPEDLKHATFYHKHNQKKLAYWEMSAPDRFR